MEELECEGIEPILIDWQGGFLGSVANDLMWALFPFFEKDNKLYSKVDISHIRNRNINYVIRFMSDVFTAFIRFIANLLLFMTIFSPAVKVVM